MKSPGEITTTLASQLKDLSPEQKEVVDIIDFAVVYGDTYGETIIPHLERGLELSKKINYQAGAIICLFNLKFFFNIRRGAGSANYKLPETEELASLLETIKHDTTWYGFGLNLLSYFHWFRGEYDKGFSAAFTALKISESEERYVNRAWNYYALGVFYFDTKDFDSSGTYYRKSIEYFERENYLYGTARAKNGLASVLIVQQRPREALPLIEAAANLYRDYEHDAGLSRSLNDMGLIEKSLGNHTRAIEILEESIALRRKIKHLQGLITSLTELGEVSVFTSNSAAALLYLKEALMLAREAGAAQKESRIHKLLYDIYKQSGQTEKALEHFEKFYAIMSKLLNDEAAHNIKTIQTQFAKEKSEKEAEIERLKNIELKEAYETIEQKNKDILDSITYARRIQNSLMPTEKYIEQKLSALRNVK